MYIVETRYLRKKRD